jgi:hypothetical protein
MKTEIKSFAYANMKNLDQRQAMLQEPVSRIGWQAGGFGIFNEQARVITKIGSDQIKKELDSAFKNSKIKDLESLLAACPTLESAIG